MKKISFKSLRYFAIVFVFYFTACPAYDPHFPPITSIKEAEEWLATQKRGDSPDNPLFMRIEMDLGDLSKPDNNYLHLLAAVEKTKKFVQLGLNQSTMGGTTVFTSYPFTEAPRQTHEQFYS
jgi:hypothetical protein